MNVPHQDKCRTKSGHDCTCSPERIGWRKAEDQLRAAEATIKRLEAEKDRLNEESSRNVSYAQFDNHQLREERGRLLETCAVDAGLAAEKEETIRRLQAKVAELEATIFQLEKEYADREQEQQDEIDLKSACIDGQSAQIATQAATISTLTAALEALNSELRSDFLKLKEQNLTHTQKKMTQRRPKQNSSPLTRRQWQIIYILATEGLPYKEIARTLSTTEQVIKNQIKMIHDKIGTESSVTLVIRFYTDYALRMKATAAWREGEKEFSEKEFSSLQFSPQRERPQPDPALELHVPIAPGETEAST